MKKPAATTIKQRKVREERLEAAMVAVAKPKPAAADAAALSKPKAHSEGRVIYLGACRRTEARRGGSSGGGSAPSRPSRAAASRRPPPLAPPRPASRAPRARAGHIPHGFYEDQMRGARAAAAAHAARAAHAAHASSPALRPDFFGQFGEVTRVKVSRNKKSGASKHFGYVEFKHPSVAKIAAETMDNYLLFGKVLKVKVVPPSELHPAALNGANKRFVPRSSARGARALRNAARDPAAAQLAQARLLKAEGKRRKRIAAAGISFEFGGYAAAEGAEAAPPRQPTPAKAPAPAPTQAKVAEAKRKAAAAPAPAAAAPPAPAAAPTPGAKRKAVAAAAPPPAASPPARRVTRAKAGTPAAAAPAAAAVKKARKV